MNDFDLGHCVTVCFENLVDEYSTDLVDEYCADIVVEYSADLIDEYCADLIDEYCADLIDEYCADRFVGFILRTLCRPFCRVYFENIVQILLTSLF